MKRVLPYILLLLLAIFLFFYAQQTQEFTKVMPNDKDKKPLPVKFGKYLCSDCGMMIKSLKYSSQVITPSGKTFFFDDIGCMVRWLDRQSFKDKVKIWVYTLDTKRFIDPQKAWFVRAESTPIGYGFGAYESKRYNEDIFYFDEVKLFVLRGETLLNPVVKRLVLKEKETY